MSIPEALASRKQWCCWSMISRNGRPTKMPICAATGRWAKSNDSSTWTDLATAEKASRRYSGLGFMLGFGVAGIDLDACLVDGELLPWAAKILDDFPTFHELSPGGEGIKLLFTVSPEFWELSGRKYYPGENIKSGKRSAVEIFFNRRFFALTGESCGSDLQECSESIRKLLDSLEKPKPKAIVRVPPEATGEASRRAARYVEKIEVPECGSGRCNTKLYRVCCVLRNFNLTEGESYPILAGWASKSMHMWDEKELQRNLENARKQ